MFRKAKPTPTMPNLPPLPQPGMASATFLNQLSAFSLNTGQKTSPSLTPRSRQQAKTLPEEPTTMPETQFGLVGYRLYTLDEDLYLIGARGEKQKGNVSGQAKHNVNRDELLLASLAGVPKPKSGHPAPAWGCLCGFAAFFWPTSLDGPAWGSVLAEVQANGRTVVCDVGWRAERIRLNKLWVACSILPNEALQILEDRYEVPVRVLK